MRERFSDIWQKNPEFFGKSFIRVDRTAFFSTQKTVRERRFFCWKKSVSLNFFRNKQKILLVQCQQFCRKTMSVCRRKHWGSFIVKKVFFFCFPIKQFWDMKGVLFAAQSKLHSRCPDEVVDVFFWWKKELSKVCFRTFSQSFLAFVGKLQALPSKNLVSFPEKHLELEIFLDKKFLFWTFS